MWPGEPLLHTYQPLAEVMGDIVWLGFTGEVQYDSGEQERFSGGRAVETKPLGGSLSALGRGEGEPLPQHRPRYHPGLFG